MQNHSATFLSRQVYQEPRTSVFTLCPEQFICESNTGSGNLDPWQIEIID